MLTSKLPPPSVVYCSAASLIDGRHFFVGNKLSPADISVFAMLVRLQREIPDALDYFPGLSKFCDRMKRERFVESNDGSER